MSDLLHDIVDVVSLPDPGGAHFVTGNSGYSPYFRSVRLRAGHKAPLQALEENQEALPHTRV